MTSEKELEAIRISQNNTNFNCSYHALAIVKANRLELENYYHSIADGVFGNAGAA
jgi:hypothetical protein